MWNSVGKKGWLFLLMRFTLADCLIFQIRFIVLKKKNSVISKVIVLQISDVNAFTGIPRKCLYRE